MKGSEIVLKTIAATGPFGSHVRTSVFPSLPMAAAGKESAPGRRSTISSRIFSTPRSWSPAAAKRTGTIFRSRISLRRAGSICSSVRLPWLKNVSMRESSPSATISTSAS